MIKRIVKLEFKKNKTKIFKEFFKENYMKILSHEGCEKLELLEDINSKNIFFTISIWKNEEHLNNYRNSRIFKDLWKKIKLNFCNEPNAWSTKII